MTFNDLKPSRQTRQKRRDKRLAEELIECGRAGGWPKPRGAVRYRREGGDELARTKERMKLDGASKSLTDNLEPLYRFLDTHVGKHWDKVYAELCRKLDKTSMQGQHVFQHLRHMVVQKITMRDGVPHGQSEWGTLRPLRGNGRWPDFYVDPKTGMLKKPRPKRAKR